MALNLEGAFYLLSVAGIVLGATWWLASKLTALEVAVTDIRDNHLPHIYEALKARQETHVHISKGDVNA